MGEAAHSLIGLGGKLLDERSGGLAARQADALARPQRKKFDASLLGRGIAEGTGERVLERVGENGIGSAAAIPRPSMMPPEAITGTCTASTTCGTSAIVPTSAELKSAANVPR